MDMISIVLIFNITVLVFAIIIAIIHSIRFERYHHRIYCIHIDNFKHNNQTYAVCLDKGGKTIRFKPNARMIRVSDMSKALLGSYDDPDWIDNRWTGEYKELKNAYDYGKKTILEMI